MAHIQPWFAGSDHVQQLGELRRSLVGVSIESVRYTMPSEFGWPGCYRTDEAHELDMGIELGISGGDLFLAFAWAMRGIDEGLAIEWRTRSEPRVLDPDLVRIDVSPLREWSGLLGLPIQRTAVGWRVPNEGSPLMPWSFRLDLGVANVVIALGEMVDHQPSYLPDSVLVIFSETVARSYAVTPESDSSWGVE